MQVSIQTTRRLLTQTFVTVMFVFIRTQITKDFFSHGTEHPVTEIFHGNSGTARYYLRSSAKYFGMNAIFLTKNTHPKE